MRVLLVEDDPGIAGFVRKGLSEAGFVEGRNTVIDYVWTDGHSDRLPALAADLVHRRVSVIVTSAINATKAKRVRPPVASMPPSISAHICTERAAPGRRSRASACIGAKYNSVGTKSVSRAAQPASLA